MTHIQDIANVEWFFHKVLSWPIQDEKCIEPEKEPIEELLDMTDQIVDGDKIVWTRSKP